MKKGIDVSYSQKGIDWKKVKNSGVEFALIRAGYGKFASQKDEYFEKNYSGAKANTIPCGAYWYSYAKTVEEAKKEAYACLEVIKGKQFEYPIYFDLEEDYALNTGKANCSAMVRAFCSVLERAGYWTGLYMSAYHLNFYAEDDIKTRYSIWVAHVDTNKPSYSGAYGVWQYSWKGNIDGITGDVDLDYAYIDYPSEIKQAGLNGYAKQNTTANVKTPAQPDITKSTKTGTLTIDGKTYVITLSEKS